MLLPAGPVSDHMDDVSAQSLTASCESSIVPFGVDLGAQVWMV